MNLKKTFLLLMVMSLLFSPFLVQAKGATPEGKVTIDKALKKVDDVLPESMPTGDPDTFVQTQAGKIINGLMGIIGSITLLIFIASGIMWMMSMGNQDKIKKAQNTMIWAAIGLFVVFISYVVVNYLLDYMVF